MLHIDGVYKYDDDKLCIVMERLEHKLARECVRTTDLCPARFSKPGHIYLNSRAQHSLKLFVTQIARQLSTIHRHHYIHFDIKPENLMFNAVRDRWCIIDFDLMLDTTKNASHVAVDHYRGTQSWTSPEMSTRASVDKPCMVDCKTDIFSFALVIVWIVNGGIQPYLLQARDVENVHCKALIEKASWRRDKVYFDKLLKGGYAFLVRYLDQLSMRHVITPDLAHLLKHMLHFDAKQRYDIKQVLNHAWLRHSESGDTVRESGSDDDDDTEAEQT